jgi:hypothetical protein
VKLLPDKGQWMDGEDALMFDAEVTVELPSGPK